MLIRGCYPLVGVHLSTSPLLILQFSNWSIRKGRFPLTLPHPPFIILSFSHCDLTLSGRLPSALLPPLTSALPFIYCHSAAVACIILLQMPPWTLSEDSKLLLNKVTTQLYATFSQLLKHSWGSFLKFSLPLVFLIIFLAPSSEPPSCSLLNAADHAFFDLFVLFYVLSIGKSIQSQGFSFQGFEDYSQIFISHHRISTVHTHISNCLCYVLVEIVEKLWQATDAWEDCFLGLYYIAVLYFYKENPSSLSLKMKFIVICDSLFPGLQLQQVANNQQFYFSNWFQAALRTFQGHDLNCDLYDSVPQLF